MMHQPLNSFQRKNRQKARSQFLRQFFLFSVVALTAWACYKFGAEQERARIGQKAIELDHVVEERDQLRQRVIDLEAGAVEGAKKLEESESRYRVEIPDDQVRALITLVRDKMAAGVSVERLNTVLTAASNPRNCRDRDVKRFILSTPISQGTQNFAGFGNGAVTVSGVGQSVINKENKAEAWYDPQKPVKMTFRLIGGKVTVAEGALPLQHSIIDDNVEYRFTVSPSNTRGFIDVSGAICDYP